MAEVARGALPSSPRPYGGPRLTVQNTSIPGAALVATEGLGHRNILQQAEVLAAAADFVAA